MTLFCKDCRFYFPSFYSTGAGQTIPAVCEQPDMLNIVTGGPSSPEANRGVCGDCGPQGKRFEKREVKKS